MVSSAPASDPSVSSWLKPNTWPNSCIVTWAIDLGIIVPLVVVAAAQLHRRTSLGFRLATYVVLLNVTIGVSLLGQGAAQLLEDAPLTPGERVGAIGGFAVLTFCSIGLALKILRGMQEPRMIGQS